MYEIFKIDKTEILKLEDYFLEYFIRLLKRLKDINFEINQGDAVGIIGRNVSDIAQRRVLTHPWLIDSPGNA